jgi:hypothetical protein
VLELQKLKAHQFQGGDLFTFIESPLLRNAVKMTDKELSTDLKDSETFVDDTGAMNFGGFTLRAGTRKGNQCLWIQNNLRDAPHLVIACATTAQNEAVS